MNKNIRDNELAVKLRNIGLISLAVFFYFFTVAYFNGMFNNIDYLVNGLPKTSISGVRGILIIHGYRSKVIEKSEPLLLKFDDSDYLKLSKYILHRNGSFSASKFYSIRLDSLTFTEISGYKNDKSSPQRFSIAYDKQKRAVLIPTDNFNVFCKAYNRIIEKYNYNASCSSHQYVENYIRFLNSILDSNILVERIYDHSLSFDKENLRIYNMFSVEDFSEKNYESLKKNLIKENYDLQKDKAVVTFSAYDRLKAFDGELILYNITYKISQNGRIDIKPGVVLRRKCQRLEPSD